MFFTKFISSYILVFSCFCHFLCCGVPFTLSVLSVSANIGLPTILFSNLSIEKIEPILLITSTLILLLLILSEIHSRRIDCTNENNCKKEICDDSKKKIIKINLYISFFLYFFNLTFFTLERF